MSSFGKVSRGLQVLIASACMVAYTTGCRGMYGYSGESAGAGPEISDEEFQAEVLDSPTPVLVNFWQEGCGYCVTFDKKLETFGKEYEGRVKVYKVDVQSNRRLASQYAIRGTPTSIFFKNGKAEKTVVGDVSTTKLNGAADEVLR